MAEEKERVEFRISKHLSWIPFIIFVIALSSMAFQNVFSMEAATGWIVISVIVGMFFAKNISKYWDSIRRGMSSRPAILMAMIYIIVGIFCALMAKGQIAEGFVWLGNEMGMTGGIFVAFTFIVSAIFGVATGTSFGTLAAMTVVLFPSGIILGANPIFLLGAILSGAALGDNWAPVSDTTIISATTQEYTKKKGVAEIGGVVSSRAKYTIIAAVAAAILFALVGGGGESVLPASEAQEIMAEHSNPVGLFMLIPVVVLIILMVKWRVPIYTALAAGIISAFVVGLSTNLLSIDAIFMITPTAGPIAEASGVLVSGITNVIPVIIFVLAIFAIIQLIIESGSMDSVVNGLFRLVGKTPRNTEISLWGITTGWCFLTCGNPTGINAMLGPLVSKVGSAAHIHPYRRANIMDAVSNTWSYFLPFGIMLIIGISFASMAAGMYPFITVPALTDMFFAVFYCWALWITIGIAAITGFGREFEGKGGRRIKAWFSNKVPEEAL